MFQEAEVGREAAVVTEGEDTMVVVAAGAMCQRLLVASTVAMMTTAPVATVAGMKPPPASAKLFLLPHVTFSSAFLMAGVDTEDQVAVAEGDLVPMGVQEEDLPVSRTVGMTVKSSASPDIREATPRSSREGEIIQMTN